MSNEITAVSRTQTANNNQFKVCLFEEGNALIDITGEHLSIMFHLSLDELETIQLNIHKVIKEHKKIINK